MIVELGVDDQKLEKGEETLKDVRELRLSVIELWVFYFGNVVRETLLYQVGAKGPLKNTYYTNKEE